MKSLGLLVLAGMAYGMRLYPCGYNSRLPYPMVDISCIVGFGCHEIDLLYEVHPTDSTPGVRKAVSDSGNGKKSNRNAISLAPNSQIRIPQRLVLPEQMPRHFIFVSRLKSESPLGGYLFAVLDSSDTVVQLGVYMHPVDNFKQNISVYYSDTRPNKRMAGFVTDDFTGSWIWLSLKLHGDDMTLFVNCKSVSTVRVERSPNPLRFDMVSTVFIGQGGPVLNNHFVVSFEGSDRN